MVYELSRAEIFAWPSFETKSFLASRNKSKTKISAGQANLNRYIKKFSESLESKVIKIYFDYPESAIFLNFCLEIFRIWISKPMFNFKYEIFVFFNEILFAETVDFWDFRCFSRYIIFSRPKFWPYSGAQTKISMPQFVR